MYLLLLCCVVVRMIDCTIGFQRKWKTKDWEDEGFSRAGGNGTE